MIKIYTLETLFNPDNELIVLFGLQEKLKDIELNNNHNGGIKVI